MYRITFALSGHVWVVGCVWLRVPQRWLGVYWLPIASEYDSSILSIASECLFKVLMFNKQMFI